MTTPNTAALLASSNWDEYVAAGGTESKANQTILKRLVDRHVLCCMSYMMTTISKIASVHGRFGDTTDQEIADLMEYPADWEEEGKQHYWEEAESFLEELVNERNESKLRTLYDCVIGEPDAEEGEEGYPATETLISELQESVLAEFYKIEAKDGTNHGWEIEESNAEDWKELCEEQRIGEPNRREVLEHWAVTEDAYDWLKGRGEPVGEVEGVRVWGRGTSGQAIWMDFVWTAIAASMKILEGQERDWSKTAG